MPLCSWKKIAVNQWNLNVKLSYLIRTLKNELDSFFSINVSSYKFHEEPLNNVFSTLILEENKSSSTATSDFPFVTEEWLSSPSSHCLRFIYFFIPPPSTLLATCALLTSHFPTSHSIPISGSDNIAPPSAPRMDTGDWAHDRPGVTRMMHNSSASDDKSSRHWAEKRHIDFPMINKWKIIVFH